ncbi:MAG: ABC transporter permease [Deltaproteobacteria bacterium RIFCSPLOWO2_02_FULL_50_16]|nr:MAG: ABC transporter permease [Deltaproteobacteria bacterium GWA2_50_8]OGQ26628.1 MAG: ABC transporter permease [Deltaproteobacteria bacterium RIFCSPHIGHO2_02_FULL_50_15]OGQ57744.1 MAG: ABC transporter permease [Deltaproteobacteria bacterium RIFCSPLOWO2_02_FULL_50_16]OGQ68795.1 MAG: ABC transporter permease [Deltaproteobacteria bacterium RIFCSPLOWO2_12_FULL_50_11]
MTQLNFQGPFEVAGSGLMTFIRYLGDFFLFVRSYFLWNFRPPWRWALTFKQMEFIGIYSLPIIVLTATFSGMVFGLQIGYAFRAFNAESMVGSTVGLALTREIGPVFASLMVAARAGSAMAAEIGSMKVTEQLDAMSTMAVNPIQYLVVPRVTAGVLVVPLLSIVYIAVGILGAYVVSIYMLHIPDVYFIQKLEYYVDPSDVMGGVVKAAVFGFLLALISCYCGYRTEGGAEGVGRSTTKAVVVSSVTILVTDYFLTSWILEFF